MECTSQQGNLILQLILILTSIRLYKVFFPTDFFESSLHSGLEVDVASIKGGKVPIDWQSFMHGFVSSCVKRYKEDDDLQKKLENR